MKHRDNFKSYKILEGHCVSTYNAPGKSFKNPPISVKIQKGIKN